MVKATGTLGGRRTLFLGLEQVNIDRLRDGKPIRFDRLEAGVDLLSGVQQIVILWGESTQEIVDALRLAQGVVPIDG